MFTYPAQKNGPRAHEITSRVSRPRVTRRSCDLSDQYGATGEIDWPLGACVSYRELPLEARITGRFTNPTRTSSAFTSWNEAGESTGLSSGHSYYVCKDKSKLGSRSLPHDLLQPLHNRHVNLQTRRPPTLHFWHKAWRLCQTGINREAVHTRTCFV